MFVNFFFQLKSNGIPVSIIEWLTLMDALDKGLAYSSLTDFYYLARAVLVKNEAHYDRFDQAFLQQFGSIDTNEEMVEEAIAMLSSQNFPISESELVERTHFNRVDLEDIKEGLIKRLRTQKGVHQGGDQKVGGGGSSPFGHSGSAPTGMRIGGASTNLTAVKVAAQRNYKSYRDDQITNTRQFEMALRRLRQLSSRLEGPRDELDIDGTIEATAGRGGLLKLVWDRPRRNNIKVILLLESAGSIDRFRRIVTHLFMAANRTTHFKELKYYYFHNCVYDNVYKRHIIQDQYALNTKDFIRRYSSDYKLIIVGDACMAETELTMAGGAVAWNEFNEEPGLTWLRRLARHFTHSVWLNPVPRERWGSGPDYHSIPLVQDVFPMFELTPKGLEQATKVLLSQRS